MTVQLPDHLGSSVVPCGAQMVCCVAGWSVREVQRNEEGLSLSSFMSSTQLSHLLRSRSLL